METCSLCHTNICGLQTFNFVTLKINNYEKGRIEKIYNEFQSQKNEIVNKKFKINPSYYKRVAIPLALALAGFKNNGILKVFISGGQGSGKTTLSIVLKYFLENFFNKKVAIFSIDDLYLSKKNRLKLAKNIHPLLKTRGVPGTHDIELGIKVIKSLISKKNKKTLIPKFSKEKDDMVDKSYWKIFNGTPDIIIIEGWCMGAKPMRDDFWHGPINSLEESHDPNGFWSMWVNKKLAGNYQDFFNMFDLSVYVQSKNFKQIIKNRLMQENIAKHFSHGRNGYMDEKEVLNFVMHFERITENMKTYMPQKSNFVLKRSSKNYFSIIKSNF